MARRLASLLLLLPLAGTGRAVADEPPQGVQDLAYGEALFHYYQDDYFNTGVHLLAALDRKQLPHHADDATLLLGGLQLFYGMPVQARHTLEKLLPTRVAPPLRDRAWFQLAKLSYQSRDLAEASDALQHLSGNLPTDLTAEARQLDGLVLLAQDKPQEALVPLTETKAPAPWNLYLAYDHALALLRNNQIDMALAEFDRVGNADVRTDEEAEIRDRANLAGGYAALRAGRASQAQPFFQRIRLHSDSAHMALLGAGWAAADADGYQASLTPWQALAAEPPHDDAVLEGLLALPYAYAQLGQQTQASSYYEHAITSYHAERQRIAAVRREIEAGALPATLEAQERPGLTGRLQGVNVPLDSPVTSYLPDLLAGHDFQEALKDYLDLRQLQNNLAQWAASLGAFDTMLEARRSRFAQVLPRIDNQLAAINPSALQARRDHLHSTLTTIRTQQDDWGVALPHELELRHWITQLQSRIDKLPYSMQKRDYAERVRRLRGVLYWQVHAAFPQRLWDKTKAVRAIDSDMEQLKKHLDTLHDAHRFADSRVKGLGERIARQRQHIEQLQPRLAHAVDAQVARLERLALAALDERDRMLDSYLLQAQFALARVYDGMQGKEVQP